MSEQQARLKIDLAAKKVEVEGSEKFVKGVAETVKALIDSVNKIEIKGVGIKESEVKEGEPEEHIQVGKIKGVQLGNFIKGKQVTQGQKAALIAEWLRQNSNKEIITVDEIKASYGKLDDPCPDRLDATIRQASAGGKKLFKPVARGRYQLTYQGKAFAQKGKEGISRQRKKRRKKKIAK